VYIVILDRNAQLSPYPAVLELTGEAVDLLLRALRLSSAHDAKFPYPIEFAEGDDAQLESRLPLAHIACPRLLGSPERRGQLF